MYLYPSEKLYARLRVVCDFFYQLPELAWLLAVTKTLGAYLHKVWVLAPEGFHVAPHSQQQVFTLTPKPVTHSH